MSGSPSGLWALPSVAVAPSIEAASCPRETSRGGGQRPPIFLSAVAAFNLAADVSDHVLRDKEVFNSRPRPRNAYAAPPDRRARRNGAHRLLAASGLGPSPCGTGSGKLLRYFEKADI